LSRMRTMVPSSRDSHVSHRYSPIPDLLVTPPVARRHDT